MLSVAARVPFHDVTPQSAETSRHVDREKLTRRCKYGEVNLTLLKCFTNTEHLGSLSEPAAPKTMQCLRNFGMRS
jgi:hypothetical protein